MNLAGQHVLVTGGSSGIGLAIAQLCAAEGAKLSLLARGKERLEAARQALRGPGRPDAFMAAVDVSIDAAVTAAIRDAERVHGPVDVLVTSAGIARPGYFEEVPTEVFERTMAVNYFGTLYPIRAVVPAMRARRHGAVVLISSGAGLIGLFGYTPYSPTKFAVRGLAESLRGELRPAGVHVMIVYPPDTETPQLHEESLTKPVETKAITAGGGLWSAEAVARVTLEGLRKGRFCVAPGFQISALARLHSILAPILFSSFDKTAQKARRKAGLPPA